MRIDETSGAPEHPIQVQRRLSPGARQARLAGSAGDAPGAELQISARGLDIARAKGIALAAGESRTERIAELRQQIQNGTYRVDSRAVAQGILAQLVGEID